MSKLRDKFGHDETMLAYNNPDREPPTIDIDGPTADGAGITYQRFYNMTPCAVWRITVTEADGRRAQTFELGWGAWADRATLTYQPLSDPLITEG